MQFSSLAEDTLLCSTCTWLGNVQVTVKHCGFHVPEHRISFFK